MLAEDSEGVASRLALDFLTAGGAGLGIVLAEVTA